MHNIFTPMEESTKNAIKTIREILPTVEKRQRAHKILMSLRPKPGYIYCWIDVPLIKDEDDFTFEGWQIMDFQWHPELAEHIEEVKEVIFKRMMSRKPDIIGYVYEDLVLCQKTIAAYESMSPSTSLNVLSANLIPPEGWEYHWINKANVHDMYRLKGWEPTQNIHPQLEEYQTIMSIEGSRKRYIAYNYRDTILCERPITFRHEEEAQQLESYQVLLNSPKLGCALSAWYEEGAGIPILREDDAARMWPSESNPKPLEKTCYPDYDAAQSFMEQSNRRTNEILGPILDNLPALVVEYEKECAALNVKSYEVERKIVATVMEKLPEIIERKASAPSEQPPVTTATFYAVFNPDDF